MSIQVGLPAEYVADEATGHRPRVCRTSFFKQPVQGPVWVGSENIAGDGQADRRHHGGPDKAILAYSAEHYPWWRTQWNLDLPYGGFGENLTILALDEGSVHIGDRWQVGPVQLEVSQPRQPCWKLGRRWNQPQLPKWVVQSGRGGWYFRVLQEGYIEADMELKLVERGYPRWSIRRANDAMYGRLDEAGDLRELAALPKLAAAWKSDLG